jgi:hypothetical protein
MTTALKYDVASVLERETDATIESWYARVECEADLIRIPLTREERCAHLPAMFRDLVFRLRNPLPLGSKALKSTAARAHGCLRRDQRYTAAMMVEESRMLQVSLFQTLQKHIEETESGVLLLYIMSIADEVDSQLAQAMTSYISEANQDGGPEKP